MTVDARRLPLLLLVTLALWVEAPLVAEPPPEPPVPPAGSEPAEEPPAEEPPAEEEADASQPKLPKRLPEIVPEEELQLVDVVFRADAEALLWVDGEELGPLVAGEPTVFPLRVGQHRVRAVSARFPEAEFTRTVRVRDGSDGEVSVKLERPIRDLQRRQRRERILRRDEGPRPLMWSRRDNGADVRWAQAERYCSDLSLGGYEDWRLPTVEELKSIQALWSVAPLKIIGAFTLTGCCPWSAEREGEKAWNFNFRYRRPFLGSAAYSLDLRALCVRDWDPEAEMADEAAGEGERGAGEAEGG
ncbi:MAG: DUF1566 domain-containing protein [Thermoanaerobaculia bacterium]|nr:DUF1566 domain-containing protein [Thermoanaerobaculia bacterium]